MVVRERLEGFCSCLPWARRSRSPRSVIGAPYKMRENERRAGRDRLLLVFANVLSKPRPWLRDVVSGAFLPRLVFESALFADSRALRAAALRSLALSVPGVALSRSGERASRLSCCRLPFSRRCSSVRSSPSRTLSVVLHSFRSTSSATPSRRDQEGIVLFTTARARL